MFKHYVFNYENKNFDHIQEDIHGAVGNIDDNLAKKIRALLLNNLNRQKVDKLNSCFFDIFYNFFFSTIKNFTKSSLNGSR